MNTALTHSLTSLGLWLRDQGYGFVTPTPASHALVNARPEACKAANLRDIFGWSRPFEPALLDLAVLEWLREADLLDAGDGLLKSRVRFSSLGEQLYAHSAFPTTGEAAVFFGPDTYRFADFVRSELLLEPLPPGARVLDVCCGAGPGGIEAALTAGIASAQLVLADINPHALAHARSNAHMAGLRDVVFAEGDLFAPVAGDFDLIIANPPYLVDAARRAYRHGGGELGTGLSERIVAEGLQRLAPGGRLLLYTGVAMVDGLDPFLRAMQAVLAQGSWPFRYRELDPDVFGEELATPAYAHAERIAAVALVVQRPRSVAP